MEEIGRLNVLMKNLWLSREMLLKSRRKGVKEIGRGIFIGRWGDYFVRLNWIDARRIEKPS